MGWLREHVDLPEGMTGRELGEVLIRAGLEVETVEAVGAEISGPVVVGRVLRTVDEPQKNGKVIRWVQVDVGPAHIMFFIAMNLKCYIITIFKNCTLE